VNHFPFASGGGADHFVRETFLPSIMKIILLVLGLVVAVFAFVVDLKSDTPAAGFGYFVLAGSMFLAAGLCKSDDRTDDRFRATQEIYTSLARKPLAMADLLKVLTGDDVYSYRRDQYQAVIGRMLVSRQLVIRKGLVALNEHKPTAASGTGPSEAKPGS
jgi:hypothetical protein